MKNKKVITGIVLTVALLAALIFAVPRFLFVDTTKGLPFNEVEVMDWDKISSLKQGETVSTWNQPDIEDVSMGFANGYVMSVYGESGRPPYFMFHESVPSIRNYTEATPRELDFFPISDGKTDTQVFNKIPLKKDIRHLEDEDMIKALGSCHEFCYVFSAHDTKNLYVINLPSLSANK